MWVRGESGQSAPLVAVLLVVAVGSMMVIVELGRRGVELAEAQTAADAAALAGAMAGDAAAKEVAVANGAQLELLEVDGRRAEVTITIGAIRRRAAAEAQSDGDNELAPAMAAALATTEALWGRDIPIASGYRSRAEQQWLWDNRDENPYPVARPGTSMHERGLAIDVPDWLAPWLARVGPTTGLCQPLPATDPVHFELCRRKPTR